MTEQALHQNPVAESQHGQQKPNFVLTREMIGAAVDAGHGHNTDKLVNQDFPEVYIRRLKPEAMTSRDDPNVRPGHEQPIDGLRQNYRDQYDELRSFGVEVPPFKIVEDKGEIVIITQKVHGVAVTEIKDSQDPKLLKSLDKTIAGEVDYIKAQRTNDGEYAIDARGIGQLMYGHYDGETTDDDRVIMVDIDPNDYAFESARELKSDGVFLGEITILAAESLTFEQDNPSLELTEAKQRIVTEITAIKETSDREHVIRQAQKLLDAVGSRDAATLQQLAEI